MTIKPYYQDGDCTIYHGDCREILPQIDSVDHVITDPPYSRDVYMRMRKADSHGPNCGNRLRKTSPGIEAMKAGAIGNINEIAPIIANDLARITKQWALVFSDVEYIHQWRQMLVESGLRYFRTGAWIKPDAMPQMTGDRPGVGFEPVTILHSKAKARWNGGGRLGVWSHMVVKDPQKGHPCPKPLSLMTELIALFTREKETIIDPFMGSGTTLLAAKNLGRKAIGIEIEEKFCALAVRRLRQEVLPL